MRKPGVLILAPDAREYVPLLENLVGTANLTIAENVADARLSYGGQPVVLGQPDLVAAVFSEMPELRWVQSTWAGVEPLLGVVRPGCLLTGIKDTFGSQMAEYVLAYMLAQELKIYQRLGRQAQRSWWDQPSGTLKGKTLGIMGTGSIGRHIARMAKPYGMHIIGLNRRGAMVEGFDSVYATGRLEEFLALPDYLVCVLPDTPATRHLLDESSFQAMRNSCCLINVGRGNVIDEEALIRALFAGELAAAVLDVFQHEPLPEDSPLWNAPGVIVTGHVAAVSWPQDIARIFRENYRRYCKEKPLKYLVDFERGY